MDKLQKDQEIEEDEKSSKKKTLEEKKKANFKHNIILDKISIPRVKQVFECIIDEIPNENSSFYVDVTQLKKN